MTDKFLQYKEKSLQAAEDFLMWKKCIYYPGDYKLKIINMAARLSQNSSDSFVDLQSQKRPKKIRIYILNTEMLYFDK